MKILAHALKHEEDSSSSSNGVVIGKSKKTGQENESLETFVNSKLPAELAIRYKGLEIFKSLPSVIEIPWFQCFCKWIAICC
jgi:hypothetical protein